MGNLLPGPIDTGLGHAGGVARHNGILVPKFAGNDTVGANNGVVGDNRIF